MPAPPPSLKAPRAPSRNRVSEALAAQRPVLAAAGLFSGVLNVLALTGAFYMLQIYDRVLPSGSVPTLVGLTVLMAILYAAFGLLDFVRLRLMGRVGVRIDAQLAEPAFAAMQNAAIRRAAADDPANPLRDLEHIRSFMSGLGPTALFDMPWVPLYLGVIYLFHPMLGLFAVAGAALLIAFTAVGEFASTGPMRRMAESHGRRQTLSEAARREAEAIRALGMGNHMNGRWRTLHAAHLAEHAAAAQVASGLSSAGRVLRLGLQSGILGLGAYLAIKGDVSPGTIVAGSITLSRALAPLETAIQHWRGFVAARLAYRRLTALFDATGLDGASPDAATQLPTPERTLDVQNLLVTPPGAGKPAVSGVSFSLVAGDGLGIIGPTASGKSTLAKALVGIWPPAHPQAVVSLDGAHISQWQPDSLGRHIGYMPQDARLIDGSIAGNISRFDPAARDADIVTAAKRAGCHEMIVALPQGYDTPVGDGGGILSGGQRQRIALARALYGDPFLVVLDEPNSNLDQEGDAALQAAVKEARERGAIVVVVAHRPSAIANLNRLLVLAGGQPRDYGPRDEVLRRIIGATPRTVPHEGAEGPIGPRAASTGRTREDADA